MKQTNQIPEELRHIIPGFGIASADGVGAMQAMESIAAQEAAATEIARLAAREQAENDFLRGWNRFAEITHKINVEKGFFAPGVEVNVGTQCMLICSEIAEGFEAHRKGLNDDKLTARLGLEVELADAVIRIINLGRHLGFDVARAIVEKTRYNETRPYMHGDKKC